MSAGASIASARRGSAVVAMIVVLVIAELVVIGMVVGGARDQDLSVRRMETTHAFYAADAGISMAIREVINQVDYDGDGSIGAISNDGNDANNPQLGPASFVVTATYLDGQYTLTSVATAGEAHRKAVVIVGAQSDNNVDGLQIGTRVAAADAGRLTAMAAYVKGPPPKMVRYGLYSDAAGEPDALITESTTIALSSNAFHWELLPIDETPLAAGNYWLALGVEHSNVYYSYQGGGQTRIKNNDPVADGFSSPWGSSDGSLGRQVKILAVLMRDVIGPIDFDADSDYDNANPAVTGLFRDLTQPDKINRGYDVNIDSLLQSLLTGLSINLFGADPALNFSGSGVVSDAVTLYDFDPSTAAPTSFAGGVRLEADLLVTGGGTKHIGLAGFIDETPGQEGLAVVLQEKGGADRLQLYRLPQSGDISGSTPIEQSANISVSQDSWYRLAVALMVIESDLFVRAEISSHASPTDPNSAVSASPLTTLSYTTAVSSLPGLQTSGQLGVVFDGTGSQDKGSVTNLRILGNPLIVPSLAARSIVSWSEQP